MVILVATSLSSVGLAMYDTGPTLPLRARDYVIAIKTVRLRKTAKKRGV
jgi:hypothetical protein